MDATGSCNAAVVEAKASVEVATCHLTGDALGWAARLPSLPSKGACFMAQTFWRPQPHVAAAIASRNGDSPSRPRMQSTALRPASKRGAFRPHW